MHNYFCLCILISAFAVPFLFIYMFVLCVNRNHIILQLCYLFLRSVSCSYVLFASKYYIYYSIRKIPDLFFWREKSAGFQCRALHEATLNLHTHAWIFYRLSIASVDGKQHFSEVVFSAPRLRVFENRILRRIFGPKRDENGGVEKAPQWGTSYFVPFT